MLGRVNRAIVEDIEANRYVTMLLVRLGVKAGSMTYASAGHIPGALFNRGVVQYVRTHANDTAQEIAKGIYGAARSFGVAEPQHDDITSVIAKVTNVALRFEQADR